MHRTIMFTVLFLMLVITPFLPITDCRTDCVVKHFDGATPCTGQMTIYTAVFQQCLPFAVGSIIVNSCVKRGEHDAPMQAASTFTTYFNTNCTQQTSVAYAFPPTDCFELGANTFVKVECYCVDAPHCQIVQYYADCGWPIPPIISANVGDCVNMDDANESFRLLNVLPDGISLVQLYRLPNCLGDVARSYGLMSGACYLIDPEILNKIGVTITCAPRPASNRFWIAWLGSMGVGGVIGLVICFGWQCLVTRRWRWLWWTTTTTSEQRNVTK